MSGAITGFVTGGMTSSHWFVAGTLVETIDRPIPIEQVEEGEFVLSEDPETGDVTYKRVLETYVNETTELIHLNIDGEEIVTTPAHPFYVKNIGFVLAGDLEEGTTLVDNEGNELHLLIKRWEQLQCAIPVYNFAVEDYHTYFVGSTNVLVHNQCGAENIADAAKQTPKKVAKPQKHHFFSNKNKTYTPQFEKILENYDLKLGGKWNIELMNNHCGRHTNAYHDFMLEHLKDIDEIAKGDVNVFMREFNNLKTIIMNNPSILYAKPR